MLTITQGAYNADLCYFIHCSHLQPLHRRFRLTRLLHLLVDIYFNSFVTASSAPTPCNEFKANKPSSMTTQTHMVCTARRSHRRPRSTDTRRIETPKKSRVNNAVLNFPFRIGVTKSTAHQKALTGGARAAVQDLCLSANNSLNMEILQSR